MPFLGFNPSESTTAASNTIADTTTIGDGTAEDVQIRFDGANIHYHIGLDDSTDKLTFGKGDTLGDSNTKFCNLMQMVLFLNHYYLLLMDIIPQLKVV